MAESPSSFAICTHERRPASRHIRMSEATCGSTFLPRAIVVYTKDMLGFDNEGEGGRGMEVEAIVFLVGL